MSAGVDPRFADRALELRVLREWSIEELAARSGLDGPTINRIECTGVLTDAEAAAIAAAFGLTVEQMLMITRHTWRPPPNAPELGPLADRPCAYMSCGRPRAEHRLAVAVEGQR